MSLPEGFIALPGHSDRVDRVLPIAESDCVVTASLDKKLRVFSATTGKCMKTLEGHEAGVVGLASLGGSFVASGDSRPVEASLRIWDLSDGQCITSLSPGGCIWAICALGPSRFVAASRGDLVFYSHVNGKEVTETHRIERAHSDVIFDIAAHGERIVTASRDPDATVAVWNTETYEQIGILPKHKKVVRTVAMNAKRIVSGSLDGKIRIFDAETMELVRIIKGTHSNLIYCVRLLETGMILSASWDGSVCVSHPISGHILAKVELPFQVWTAASLGHGKFVAAGAFFEGAIFTVDSLPEKEKIVEKVVKESIGGLPDEGAPDEEVQEAETGLPASHLALTIRMTLRDIIARIVNRATLAIDSLSGEVWPMHRIRRRVDM